MFFHFYFLGDESTVVVVETQTRQDRQTDRQGSRNESLSVVGIVDKFTTMLFAARKF